jgi:GTPase SAR1 family protein
MTEYVTDPEINVILLGDETTGKSSLVQSYLYDTFS